MSKGKGRAAINITDAASELDVTPGHVRRLFNDGKLEGFDETGRLLMIYVDSLAEYKKRRNYKYAKPGGWTSTEPPSNRRLKFTRHRDGTPKTEAQILREGLREREYQRDYKRRRREEERQKKLAEEQKEKKGRSAGR